MTMEVQPLIRIGRSLQLARLQFLEPKVMQLLQMLQLMLGAILSVKMVVLPATPQALTVAWSMVVLLLLAIVLPSLTATSQSAPLQTTMTHLHLLW